MKQLLSAWGWICWVTGVTHRRRSLERLRRWCRRGAHLDDPNLELKTQILSAAKAATILEPLLYHDRLHLRRVAKGLKQMDGESWAVGEVVERFLGGPLGEPDTEKRGGGASR